MMSKVINLIVNGRKVEGEAEPRMHLGDFLRRALGLTGTHLGCEHGVCGSCTVIVDGQDIRSCLMLAVQADGAQITTIEGMANDGILGALQTAFKRHHALQCGFCTPGMLATLQVFLDERATATDDEVREAISGNLCRCTGYDGIVAAAMDVMTSRNRRLAAE
jgi:aerobic-type carbon monoxide dehydrogenase small subunit (CoxS/CutS family)